MPERLSAGEIDARIAASHPEIQAMVAYWRGKAGDRPMPSRGDIDPSELTAFLPRITLVDVVTDEQGQNKFVYRLVGTEEAAGRGHDPTGKSVAEAYFGPNAEETLNYYNAVVRMRAPLCYRGQFRAPDDALENQDIIFLPLSEDGETVNMVLVFFYDYLHHSRVDASSVLLRYQHRDEGGERS